jgi:hypothetical protein
MMLVEQVTAMNTSAKPIFFLPASRAFTGNRRAALAELARTGLPVQWLRANGSVTILWRQNGRLKTMSRSNVQIEWSR